MSLLSKIRSVFNRVNPVKKFRVKNSVYIFPINTDVLVTIDLLPLEQEMESLIQLKIAIENELIVISLVEFFLPSGGAARHIDERENGLVAVKIESIVNA